MEEGQVHAGTCGRGFRRSHHQRYQVWFLRRTNRPFHRRPGPTQHPGRRPVRVSREHAADYLTTHSQNLQHGRPHTGAGRPHRSGGEKDSVRHTRRCASPAIACIKRKVCSKIEAQAEVNSSTHPQFCYRFLLCATDSPPCCWFSFVRRLPGQKINTSTRGRSAWTAAAKSGPKRLCTS